MINLLFDESQKFNPKKLKIFPKEFFKNRLVGLDSMLNTGSKPVTTYDLKKSGKWLILVIFLGLALMLFITRAVKLQLLNTNIYTLLAQQNKTRKSTILAERGVILGSDGKVLVRNRPSFALQINSLTCGENLCTIIIEKLKKLVPFDDEQVKKDLVDGKQGVVFALGISKEQVLQVEANLYQLPGVSVVVYPIRDYELGPALSHALGYVGLDEKSLEPKIVGKTGIEKIYDQYLQGISGSSISEVDSTGTKYEVIAKEDSLPGRNITTFINSELSQKAYELLKTSVDDKKAKAGVVVAQDPQTGGILALVSYPAFDPNKMVSGISTAEYSALTQDKTFPFFNRAISASYPPGSTFKMVTASAGLSEKTITKNTTIFDPGYIQIGTYIFRNWNTSGHGEVNLLRALQVSNDTYFYTVGGGYGSVKGVGIEKLASWAKKFGYGNLTGVDLDGEVEGYFPDGISREWYLGDTYITSIGQGDVLATPLQVNNVTSYFANGGYLMQPSVVKNIQGFGEFEPKIISQNLISKENYDLVREGMRLAVSPGGTGYPVYDFPDKHNGILLAGKTGTSEYIDSTGKPATHALFTVFGPLQGKATIALTVFLEGGGGGADDAAPIARELLDVWFKP